MNPNAWRRLMIPTLAESPAETLAETPAAPHDDAQLRRLPGWGRTRTLQ